MTLTKSQKARRKNKQRPRQPRPNQAMRVLERARAIPNKRVARLQRAKAALSKAAHQYALCLSNPFSGPLAGIPDYPVTPSQKTRCFARGTFSTGTNDGGFVALNPYFPGNDATLTGSNCPIFQTDATFAGTNFDAPPTAGVTGARFTNCPYTGAQIGVATDDINYRVVAAGLRARYIDTVLNRGGRYFALQSPGHDYICQAGGPAISTAGNFDTAYVDQVHTDWVTVLHRPIDAGELAFSNQSGEDGAQVSMPAPYMVIGVIGPSGTPIQFEWEAFVVYEFIGAAATAKTATEADPTGFSAVLNAANSTVHLAAPHAGDSSRVQRGFLQDAWDFFAGKGGVVDFIDGRANKAIDGIERLLPLILALGL